MQQAEPLSEAPLHHPSGGPPPRTGEEFNKIVLFLLVWFSCAWFGSWEYNVNTATRMYAAVSLVEGRQGRIDEFAHLTIDKAQFGEHFYSDKAPGMTLMALPAVAIANRVTGERSPAFDKWMGDPGLTRFLRLRTRIAAATGPALLTAVAAVLLYDLGLALTGSAGAALFAALGFALGTPVWGWSTTLFGHAAVAALYVIAVWAVWGGTRGQRARLPHALIAGLSLGWAVVVEYQAVLAGSAIGLWALWRLRASDGRWAAIGAAALGAVIAAVPLVAYNLTAFGTVFRLGYQGVVGWEGMNRGLFGLTEPSVAVFWKILFPEYRGLIWVAPVLLMAWPGLGLMLVERRHRATGVMASGVVLVTLLVNAAYVYWDGGNSTGPRLAMPMAGVLALGLAAFWAVLETWWQKALAGAVLTLSIAINAAIASAEILSPPPFKRTLLDGVLKTRFWPGDLRTVPSEWWGWTPWHGFFAWVAVAVPLILWLAYQARLSPRTRCQM